MGLAVVAAATAAAVAPDAAARAAASLDFFPLLGFAAATSRSKSVFKPPIVKAL